jgi:hypothetical protein
LELHDGGVVSDWFFPLAILPTSLQPLPLAKTTTTTTTSSPDQRIANPFPSPSLVANLWDVTDRDIDRLSEAVFHKLHLDASRVPDAKAKTLGVMPLSELSTVQAVNGSREDCKLKYLTGAAPVVYGLPVYLH